MNNEANQSAAIQGMAFEIARLAEENRQLKLSIDNCVHHINTVANEVTALAGSTKALLFETKRVPEGVKQLVAGNFDRVIKLLN